MPFTRSVPHVHSIDALFTECFFFFSLSLSPPLCALEVKRCTAAITVVSEGSAPSVAVFISPYFRSLAVPCICLSCTPVLRARCV